MSTSITAAPEKSKQRSTLVNLTRVPIKFAEGRYLTSSGELKLQMAQYTVTPYISSWMLDGVRVPLVYAPEIMGLDRASEGYGPFCAMRQGDAVVVTPEVGRYLQAHTHTNPEHVILMTAVEDDLTGAPRLALYSQ